MTQQTKWACGNTNQTKTLYKEIDDLKTLIVYEQDNYGVVDLALVGRSGTTRFTNNKDAQKTMEIECNGTVSEVVVWEQDHYGVVDVGLKINGSLERATDNSNSDRSFVLQIPKGSSFVGLGVKEQENYGIVDIRAKYRSNAVKVTPSVNLLYGTDGEMDKSEMKIEIKVKTGYSSDETISKQLNGKIATEVEAKGNYYAAEVSGKVSAEVGGMISNNLTIKNTTEKEEKLTITINAAKPCYVYQMSFQIRTPDDNVFSVSTGSWFMSHKLIGNIKIQ